jgi:hypothetical protein
VRVRLFVVILKCLFFLSLLSLSPIHCGLVGFWKLGIFFAKFRLVLLGGLFFLLLGAIQVWAAALALYSRAIHTKTSIHTYIHHV